MCNEVNPSQSVSELGLLTAGQHICRRSLNGGVKKQNKTFQSPQGEGETAED